MYTIAFYSNNENTGSTTISNREDTEDYFMACVERYGGQGFSIDGAFTDGFAVRCFGPTSVRICLTGPLCNDMRVSLMTKCNNMLKGISETI